MPGTANGAINDEPFGEGPVVVRAIGSDREDLCPLPHEQHLFVADMTNQLAALSKIRERDSSRQIGAAGRRLILSHFLLL